MLLNLEPVSVFHFFEEISAIPRGSGNEAGIASYMVEWAEKRGLWVQRDGHNNVYIRKPASPGREDRPPVMLQGHLDMVCEKEPDCSHDFLKDPISLRVEDGFVRANGTTLGADNGIGMALIMAVLDDPDAVHPPLEALFTSGEEAGMTGARALGRSGWNFASRTLLNLDTGWEGVFVAGAAAGGRAVFETAVELTDSDMPCWRVEVRGLKGGHSGAEVHLGRGNANQLLARVLNVLEVSFRLVRVDGDGKENAITRSASAVIACEDETALRNEIAVLNAMLQREFAAADPGLEVCVAACEQAKCAVADAEQARVLRFLQLLPCGVLARDNDMDLVLTSMNIGSVMLADGRLTVRCSVRSAFASHLSHWLLPQLRTLAALCGMELTEDDFYPGWEYQSKSPIREAALCAYERITGRPASFKVLHGGLECGILMEQFHFADAVSYGAALNYPHSPSEELCIESVGTTDKLVRAILEAL